MTLRLYLHNPSTVFAARVNQASFTYPLAECEFDTVGTGAYGDIEIGMTLLFGTSAGEDDLGRQRIRTAADTNTIFFGRSSQGIRDGEVKLQDNAYITILNDYRVWAKIPFIDSDGIMSKDHDIFVDSFTDLNIPPVANAGVGFAATIDSGTSKITASWDASTSSFAVADGESISSYLWDVDDGTITVGSTSTAAITATFPAGFRWVKCTVTDSNSQTHFTRMPVYARNPAGDTTINAFTIDSHRITPQGQQISLRIRETIAENVYPDGTLVMLWEDEPASASDRTHMKFIGWHHTDPATISTQRTGILRDTVLECLDVAGKLDSLPGFPQSLESNVGPTVWTQMSNPNMDKYLHYLLHWHSTALELADWTDSGTGSGFPFVILGSDGESLFDQVDRRCKALVPDYHLVCNTLGQLAVNVDPMLQDSGSRTATIQASLGDIDWMGIQYPHQRPPRFHWLRGNAIKTSTTVISALFCVAPGESPGQGESPQEHGEQLAASQTTLNSCEGHRYARLNAPEGMYSIALAEGDDKDIEPANMAWVRLTITTSPQAAQRNLTFTNERGLVQEINIRYDHQRTGLVKTVELLWERETEGTPAVTVLIPEIEDPYVYNPPDPDPSPGPSDPDLIGDGFGTVYVFLTDTLARTRDFSASPPTWTDITGVVTGAAYDWILDPWSPKTRGFALTSTGVWKATGLDGAGTPTWTQVLVPGDVPLEAYDSFLSFSYKIQGSINVEDYFVCFARIEHDGPTGEGDRIKCCYTEDAGATWNFSTVAYRISITHGYALLASGFDVVPHLVGGDIMLYAGLNIKDGSFRCYRSVNRGATWTNQKTLVYSGRVYGSTCLNTPYKNNEDGNNVWLSFPGDSGENELYHTTDGWATYTRVPFPGIIAEDEWTRAKRLGIEVYIEDENRVMVWLENDHLFYATDAATFTEISYAGYVPATHGRVSGGGGFPNVNSQFYIVTTSRYVFVSIDGGANWINKTGNLRSVILSNETLAYSLKGVIVPMWLEE